MRFFSVFVAVVVVCAPLQAPAATPPDKVTFQGILADPLGDPLHGFFNLVAGFYDASNGGNEILVEQHLSSGSGAVAVSFGRLAVQLGTGVISDGSGPGTYTTLTAVFADFSEVWIELEIEGETLSPRIAITSTPLALNSTRLDGRAGDDFLDLSPTPQAKVGRLSATTLAIDGQSLEFAGGASISSTGASTQITAGSAGTEDLVLSAGADPGDGGISIEGGGGVDLVAGDGTFTFSNGVTDAPVAILDAATFDIFGQIRIQGGGPGAGRVLTSDATGRALWADPSPVASDPLTDLAEMVGFPTTDLPPQLRLNDSHCGLGSSSVELFVDGVLTGTVLGYIGRDAISEGYTYRVAFSTSGPPLDPIAMLGQECVIRLTRTLPTGAAETLYRGWITEAAEAGSSGGSRLYALAFEPRLANLKRHIRSRYWQDTKVSEIATEIFAEYFMLANITDTSTVHAWTAQWNESDLDFLRRLWEADGTHFHHVVTTGGVVIVVGTDNTVFQTVATPLSYHGDQADPGTGAEFVQTFRTPTRPFIGEAEVRSYDFLNDQIISESVVVGGGSGKTTDWQVDVEDAAHGTVRAWAVLGRERAGRYGFTGTGPIADLRAGMIFSLADMVTGDLTDEYLTTGITHAASVNGSCVEYGSGFDAIPAAVRFRPPLTTRRPIADGPITATVTDDEDPNNRGRFKVWFHNEGDNPFESDWLPVITPAGKAHHDAFIPEIGDEVLVDFLAGNPDRPVIVGSIASLNQPLAQSEFYHWYDPGVGFHVDGHLYMWREGVSSPNFYNRPQTIFFTDAGVLDAAWLRFLDSEQAPSPTFELSHDLHLMRNLVFSEPGSGISGDTSIDGKLRVFGDVELSGQLKFLAPSTISSPSALDISAVATLDLQAGAASSWNAGALLDLDAGTFLVDGGSVIVNATAAVNVSAGAALALDGGPEINFEADTVTTNSDTETRVMIDNHNDSTDALAAWYHNGTFDGTSLLATLNEGGDLQVSGTFISISKAGVAQSFPVSGEVQPGWLVGIDPDRAGSIRPTTAAGDPLVLGVVAGRPGLRLGGASATEAELERHWGEAIAGEYRAARPRLRQQIVAGHPKLRAMSPAALEAADGDGEIDRLTLKAFHAERFAAVAIVGQVEVAADASQGAIRPGDALSPGSRAGHAVAAREGWPVVGIALEGLAEGQGLIRMFVSRSNVTVPSASGLELPAAGKSTANLTPGDEEGWSSQPGQSLPITMTRADNPSEKVLHLGADGALSTQTSVTTGLRGMAELLPVSERVQGGEVLVVDLTQSGRFTRGHSAADPTVVGVAVERPGLLTGNNLDAVLEAEPELAGELAEAEALGQTDRRAELLDEIQAIADDSLVAVATSGTTLCRVDASYGAISPGDLLMTSSTPGHAQRSDAASPGTILGKALEPLDTGTGVIRILVMLR